MSDDKYALMVCTVRDLRLIVVLAASKLRSQHAATMGERAARGKGSVYCLC